MDDNFELNNNEIQNDTVSETSAEMKYGSVESPVFEQQPDEAAKEANNVRRKKKPFPLWLKIVIPLVACIIIAGVVVLVTGLSNNDKYSEIWQTNVPDTVNMSYDEAVKVLEDAGLRPLIEDKVASSEIKTDCIVSQSIEKDTKVGKGSVVELTLSAGKEDLQMPDLKYYSLGYAKSILENMGLNVETETVSLSEDASVAPDAVISSVPAANMAVSAGDTVKLQVFENKVNPEPSELAVVPNLIDENMESAMKKASESGIYAVVTGVATGSADKKGFVVSQNVASDVSVAKGAVIEIKINSGSESIVVPDVTYRKVEKAKAVLASSGLDSKVQYEQSDKVMKGTVIRQEKQAGSTAEEKEVVKIIVSVGKIVGIPELKGKTINSAVDKLVSSKLAVNVVFKVDKQVKEGTVISQNYNKGDRAQIGTVVTITVSGKKDSGDVPETTPLNTEISSKNNESSYDIISTTAVSTVTTESTSLPDVSVNPITDPSKPATTEPTTKPTEKPTTAEPSTDPSSSSSTEKSEEPTEPTEPTAPTSSATKEY